jgi:hypothetical protein
MNSVAFWVLFLLAVLVASVGIVSLIHVYARRKGGDPPKRRFGVIFALVAIVAGAALALFVFVPTRVNTVSVTATRSLAGVPAAHGAPGYAKIRLLAHRAPTSVGARAARRRPPASVRLEVLADAPVWICLQDQRGRLPINGQILRAGAVSQQFVSPAFRIFLGDGSVRLRINGRVQSIPPSPNPVAYGVSHRGVAVLPAGTREPC